MPYESGFLTGAMSKRDKPLMLLICCYQVGDPTDLNFALPLMLVTNVALSLPCSRRPAPLQLIYVQHHHYCIRKLDPLTRT